MSNAKRKSERVWIGLGANLGDPVKTFNSVRLALSGFMSDLRNSSLYITKPCGDSEQGDFTNAVVSGLCQLEALQLLQHLQAIERAHGKRKLRLNGPRSIDLDILFWGNCVLKSAELTIPHPRACQRDFVLLPMREVDSEWVDPVSAKTVSILLSELHEHYFTGKIQAWSSASD